MILVFITMIFVRLLILPNLNNTCYVLLLTLSAVDRNWKVLCWECGEVCMNRNLARHAKDQHRNYPGRLKRGKRPLDPRYENWKEIRDAPWATIKVLRDLQQSQSASSSEISNQWQINAQTNVLASEFCPSVMSDVQAQGSPPSKA